jgi:ATP-dependent Clp protease ATP-binding subunit ClpA
VDFKNTIIIMTSNIGSPIIQEFYDTDKLDLKAHEEMERLVRIELKTQFRPEFLNRVDDILIFHNLSEGQLESIVDIQLHRLEKRLSAQNLRLDADESARKFLAGEGYDPQFGARPLKRTIQEQVLDPLAMKVLAGDFKSGDSIAISAHEGELVFRKIVP